MPSFRPIHSPHRRGFAMTLTVATALLAMSAGQVPAAWAAKVNLEEYEVGSYQIGGDFALTNQDGKTSGLRDFRGKVVVLFFGYTHCPDICPVTLAEMSRLKKLLGADGAKVQGIFVSLDPARDSSERLKAYLANFDPGIIGLTGSARDVSQVAKLYRAKFSKRDAGSAAGYLVDHTAFVYLLDSKGKVRYLIPYDAGTDTLAAGARHLLGG